MTWIVSRKSNNKIKTRKMPSIIFSNFYPILIAFNIVAFERPPFIEGLAYTSPFVAHLMNTITDDSFSSST